MGYSFFSSDNGFIKRRILRIYPLYFFAVTFAVWLQWYIPTPYKIYNGNFITAGVLTSVANYFMLQGIAAITITFNGPLWSLGVEFFLYLLAPVFAKFSRWLNIGFCTVSILVFYFTYGTAKTLYGLPLVQFAWPWLLGFVLAKSRKIDLVTGIIAVVGSLVATKMFIQKDPLTYVTLIVCPALIFLVPIFVKKTKSIKGEAVIGFLGDLSYPLYVFHFPLALLLYYWGVRNVWLLISLVYAISVAFYYLFDVYLRKIFWKPFFNYLFRFVPQPVKYLF